MFQMDSSFNQRNIDCIYVTGYFNPSMLNDVSGTPCQNLQ